MSENDGHCYLLIIDRKNSWTKFQVTFHFKLGIHNLHPLQTFNPFIEQRQ